MTLRPFANLFCVHDADPMRIAGFERALAASGEFELCRPADGWLAGVAALPGGPSESPEVIANGLIFCEGADRVLANGSGRTPAAVRALALAAPRQLGSLPGDFTFLAFGADGDGTAVRSCGGLVPVYLSSAGSTLAIGTRLDYFIRFFSAPTLDPLVNAIWTTGWTVFPHGRTCLEGVSILARGQYAQIRRGKVTKPDAYWDPRPRSGEPPEPDPEHPRQLRELLIAALARDLDPAGRNLLTLSGGVDSSALGALAGHMGMPLAALSFLQQDPDGRARDEHYLEVLTSRVRFDPHWRVDLDVGKRLELLARPSIACTQVPHPALCILPELQAEGDVSVLFGGEYADEVVGAMSSLPDWVMHTSFRDLLTGGPSSWATGAPRDLARWGKGRLLDLVRRPKVPLPDQLPDLLRPEIRREYTDWRADRRREAGRDRRPLRQLALTGELDGWVVMNWEVASALGIRRALPFFHREVLELAFRCHPGEKIGPGTKKLLRVALRGDVPPENLERKDKGTSLVPESTWAWTQPLDEQLQAIVREDWFPQPPTSMHQDSAVALAQLTQIARARRTAAGPPLHTSPLV